MLQRGYDAKQIGEYLGLTTKVVAKMLKRQTAERAEKKRRSRKQQTQNA